MKLTKPLKVGAIAIAIVVPLIIIFFVWEILFEEPPQLIPLDNAQASYSIAKRGETYTILYESAATQGSIMGRATEVFIAKSPVELDEYVGKKVRIEGEFVNARKQCIVDTCGSGSSFVGVDIRSITLAE